MGIEELMVSLDAENLDAEFFTILSNTRNSFIIESDSDLNGYIGNDLIGVIRLDYLETDYGVSVVTPDLLYLSDFSIPFGTIDGVPHIVTERHRLHPGNCFRGC